MQGCGRRRLFRCRHNRAAADVGWDDLSASCAQTTRLNGRQEWTFARKKAGVRGSGAPLRSLAGQFHPEAGAAALGQVHQRSRPPSSSAHVGPAPGPGRRRRPSRRLAGRAERPGRSIRRSRAGTPGPRSSTSRTSAAPSPSRAQPDAPIRRPPGCICRRCRSGCQAPAAPGRRRCPPASRRGPSFSTTSSLPARWQRPCHVVAHLLQQASPSVERRPVQPRPLVLQAREVEHVADQPMSADPSRR